MQSRSPGTWSRPGVTVRVRGALYWMSVSDAGDTVHSPLVVAVRSTTAPFLGVLESPTVTVVAGPPSVSASDVGDTTSPAWSLSAISTGRTRADEPTWPSTLRRASPLEDRDGDGRRVRVVLVEVVVDGAHRDRLGLVPVVGGEREQGVADHADADPIDHLSLAVVGREGDDDVDAGLGSQTHLDRVARGVRLGDPHHPVGGVGRHQHVSGVLDRHRERFGGRSNAVGDPHRAVVDARLGVDVRRLELEEAVITDSGGLQLETVARRLGTAGEGGNAFGRRRRECSRPRRCRHPS